MNYQNISRTDLNASPLKALIPPSRPCTFPGCPVRKWKRIWIPAGVKFSCKTSLLDEVCHSCGWGQSLYDSQFSLTNWRPPRIFHLLSPSGPDLG